MPDWPDPNYDYTQALTEKNLRLVDTQLWGLEPELDENGSFNIIILLIK